MLASLFQYIATLVITANVLLCLVHLLNCKHVCIFVEEKKYHCKVYYDLQLEALSKIIEHTPARQGWEENCSIGKSWLWGTLPSNTPALCHKDVWMHVPPSLCLIWVVTLPPRVNPAQLDKCLAILHRNGRMCSEPAGCALVEHLLVALVILLVWIWV